MIHSCAGSCTPLWQVTKALVHTPAKCAIYIEIVQCKMDTMHNLDGLQCMSQAVLAMLGAAHATFRRL